VIDRALLLAKNLPRDLAAYPGWAQRRQARVALDALPAAISYLCRTHDATGRRGSSYGYSLIHGWRSAYPETTGYVIGTLLTYASRNGERGEPVERAREMGDWEIEVQSADGGVMGGMVDSGRPPIAFNTGMVLHGWLDLHRELGGDEYLAAAERAGRWLIERQDEDGAWRGEASFKGLPSTYHTRVAWALARLGAVNGDEVALAAARRNLDFALARQDDSGWFEPANFFPGKPANTHGIAYTLRGLLESAPLLEDERYLEAVRRTSETMIRKLELLGTLPCNLDSRWRSLSRYVCLTGLVQLGDVWLKLAAVLGDDRFLNAGLKAIGQAASRQERLRGAAHGALPGSFPIFGRYSPLDYPNWATKFLADALITLAARGETRT
jgi:hypothetical protein